MEGGLRFTVFQYSFDNTVHYHSFDELSLKDYTDRDLETSGFKENLEENIPSFPRFFRVGDALFMVGGLFDDHQNPTNCLWIFICGGTGESDDWAEFYDPVTGEFAGKELPVTFGCPFPSSCFQWTDQVVMVYYQYWVYNKEEFDDPSFPPLIGEDKEHHTPTLLSYNMVENNWDIFAENLPEPLYCMDKRKLIYVGGNILFIIDFARLWFVYDLSSKEKAEEVSVEGGGEDVPVLGAFYAGNKDIKGTSWVFYIFTPNNYYGLGYAKVEVNQGKGGDYIATLQMKGVLRVGPFSEVYIIAEEDEKGKEKIDDKQVNESPLHYVE
ncbi:hypothetical protein AAHA92_10028 [Salvia divinorum]|uniref:F-box protein n=1 Tax=Salvia divinorum TaxID=28513 RepID=A0ABD1HWR3_SALDI